MLYCSRCEQEAEIFIEGVWKIVGYNFNYKRIVVSFVETKKKEHTFLCSICGKLSLDDLASYCENCRALFPIDLLYVSDNVILCGPCQSKLGYFSTRTLYDILAESEEII